MSRTIDTSRSMDGLDEDFRVSFIFLWFKSAHISAHAGCYANWFASFALWSSLPNWAQSQTSWKKLSSVEYTNFLSVKMIYPCCYIAPKFCLSKNHNFFLKILLFSIDIGQVFGPFLEKFLILFIYFFLMSMRILISESMFM